MFTSIIPNFLHRVRCEADEIVEYYGHDAWAEINRRRNEAKRWRDRFFLACVRAEIRKRYDSDPIPDLNPAADGERRLADTLVSIAKPDRRHLH